MTFYTRRENAVQQSEPFLFFVFINVNVRCIEFLFFFPLSQFEVCRAALTFFFSLFTIADEQSNLNTYVNSCIYISHQRSKETK